MQILDTFDPKTTEIFTQRINQLTPESQPVWGKMNVAQMMAHLNVAYDITNGKKDPKYNMFTKFILKAFVKKIVVGDKPYKKNSQTGPLFLIADQREFEKEKELLLANILDHEKKGRSHFEGLENPGFGKLTAAEWNNLYAKHLEHHLSQFGV